jgi:hypothetical protein
VEYTAHTIQQLLSDVRPFLRPKAIESSEWFIITDYDGTEYSDDYHYMTDGFGLYITPKTGLSKLRLDYESEIQKMNLALQQKKKSAKMVKTRSWHSMRNQVPQNIDGYELATKFTLDFDPHYGPVALCESTNAKHKVNLSIVFPLDVIAKDFPQYADYNIYIKRGLSPIIAEADDRIFGVLTPIYKEG